MKKITILVAMLAMALFAAVPAFAQTDGLSIEVGEGSVTITETLTIMGSIVQDCGSSVTFGDENANAQEVVNSQDVFVDIEGDENEVSAEQSFEQSGFNPSVETSCMQSVAQAAAAG